MSTMVEKIAMAIAENFAKQNNMLQICQRPEYQVFGIFDDYDNVFYDCEATARAAIEAMKEPTYSMRKVSDFKTAEITYPAMIQAALEEGQ